MGSVVPFALEAADETGAGLLAVPCPLSFDAESAREYLEEKKILVIEDHAWLGLGAILAYRMMKAGIKPAKFEHVAIEDFTESGNWKDIYELHGFSALKIAQKVKEM